MTPPDEKAARTADTASGGTQVSDDQWPESVSWPHPGWSEEDEREADSISRRLTVATIRAWASQPKNIAAMRVLVRLADAIEAGEVGG